MHCHFFQLAWVTGNSLAEFVWGSGCIRERVAVEQRLGGGGAAEQEGFEEFERIPVLTFGGGQQREIDAEGRRAQRGTVAEADFSKDHRQAQALLGLVVGGRHAVDREKGEKLCAAALRVDQALPEVFDCRISEGISADDTQTFLEPRRLALGGGDGDGPGVARVAESTAAGEELAHALTKGQGLRILLRHGKQTDWLGEILGLGHEVRETGLAPGRVNGVVAGVVVGDKVAGPGVSEDGDGDVTGAGGVDEKEGQVRVAGLPELGSLTVHTPVCFVAMGDVRRPDLATHILMERLAERGDLAVEVHGGGGNERHAEQAGEDLAHIAIAEFDLVAQEHSGGLGDRTDLGVAQFLRCGLEDRAAATGAEGGVVDEVRYHGLGLKDNVLLAAGPSLPTRLQRRASAMRAGGRGSDADSLVDMIGGASGPERMAERRAAFARSVRLFNGRRMAGTAIGFELALVQGLVLGA